MAAIVVSDGTLTQEQTPISGWGVGSWSAFNGYAGYTSDYANLYRTQPNLRLVVNFLARNIAQLGLKPYEWVSDTERRSLGNHPLGELIRQPNPAIKVTRYRLIHALVADLAIYDTAFLLKTRNNANGQLRLWRLEPNKMRPIEANPWSAISWQYTGAPQQPVFTEDQLITFRGFNPVDGRYGLSPIESIKQTLAEGQAAANYREQFWLNGARISGVIERPAAGQAGTPRWSDDARNRFLQEWDANYTGNAQTAAGTPLLEDGMSYKQVSFSARDSEYLGARRLSREEVASFYHISPLFVGILENANFSNVKEQHRHLYQDTLGPTLIQLQEDFQLQLIPEYTDLDPQRTYLEFDLSDKLKGSFEERAQQMQAAVGAPWLTRNEARADENKAPIDGGDELITPLNLMVGAAPPGTASTEPTAKDGAAKTKAPTDLPPAFAQWAVKHQELMSSYFGRQAASVLTRLRTGESLDDIWDDARWNAELQAGFYSMAMAMGTELGSKVAASFGGSLNTDLMRPYLNKNALIAAESINETTKRALADAMADPDTAGEAATNVFDVAMDSRAEQIGVTRSTAVGNFSEQEGASQAGATTKQWRTNSNNTRHGALNGQRVAITKAFSNGARWPGDHSLPIGQRAGCTCTMSYKKEDS